jgi:hypothetical protein
MAEHGGVLRVADDLHGSRRVVGVAAAEGLDVVHLMGNPGSSGAARSPSGLRSQPMR